MLNRDSANFRDPKVSWYTNPETGESYWVMVAVEATQYQVVFYRSENLINWTYLSTFGPANATGGIWEVPDLIPMTVKETGETKWVLIVNLNPGSPAGGSGAQYFVGEFDGTTFTAENIVTLDDEQVAGTVLEDFEFASWAGSGWTVANQAGNVADGPFGLGPYPGTIPGQQQVVGYRGERLVNSFVGNDWPVGTLTSAPFTVTSDWLNVLFGGGNHPRVEGSQLGNEPPAGTLMWNGFEVTPGQTLADFGWTGTGDLQAANSPSDSGGDYAIGNYRINTWAGGPKGDDNVGTLTSPSFTIDGDHISFLIGGGREKDTTLQVQLVVDPQVVRTATGADDGALQWRSWDVSDLQGRSAQLRVVDETTGGWGHLTLDHVVMGDEPAKPRSAETTVNLVIGGEVVASATGSNSETLDWAAWNTSAWIGQSAQVVIIDNNRFGWGHILVDDIVAADAPQQRRIERFDWLDWGPDYYAANSYSNVPDGRHILQGWMSNWNYANFTPTSPWRSAMALPREITLHRLGGGYEIASAPVGSVNDLQVKRGSVRRGNIRVTDSTLALPFSSDAYMLEVTVAPGDADIAGVAVRTDADYSATAGEGTLSGIDTATNRVFVDRTRSGYVSFSTSFASVDGAPLVNIDGSYTFTVYVDRSSVEVYAEDGFRAITSQIFPDPQSLGLSLVSQGGTARFQKIVAVPLATSVHTGNRGRGWSP